MNDQVPPRPTSFSPTGSSMAADTPTSEVVSAKPKKSVTKVDSLNRAITVKFLSPLDRMRLAKIAGKDAQNEVYLGYASLAFAVTHIDDEPVSTNTIRELEFMVERLGDEGLAVVAQAYQTDFADFLKGANIELAKN